MISLGKFSGSCNAASDLSSKIYVPSKTKNANVKITNIIKNRNEAKILVKHISCDCKCKLDSKTCNSNKKWNNDKCQCGCKNYHTCKSD